MNPWDQYGLTKEQYYRKLDLAMERNNQVYAGVEKTRQRWLKGRLGPFVIVEEKK